MPPFAVAAGVPQLAGYASPEIWSALLLKKFYEATVFGAIANTDYEGEIADMGCKVIIRTTPDIQIRPYTKGMNLTHQRPRPDKVELEINQGSVWDFVIDRVDAFQADIDYVEDWTKDASNGQKIYVDTVGLSTVPDLAHAQNRGSAAGRISQAYNLGTTAAAFALTKANVLDAVVDAGVVLDEQSRPDDDRFMVLPMWAVGRIKQSDIKDASLTGDGKSVLRNGRIGIIDRFEIFGSNLVTYAGAGANRYWKCIFGHRSAINFASQFVENDVLPKVESTFGPVCRGLQVFGLDVHNSASLGEFIIKRG